MKKINIFFIFILVNFITADFVFSQSCPQNTIADEDSITFAGKILSLGNDSNVIVWFEYGENQNNLIKTKEESKKETGLYCIKVSNLKPCTQYFYRAAIKNSYGENYGEIKNVTTKCVQKNVIRNIDINVSSSEILINKCSSEKLSFVVVNNSKVKRKVSVLPEGDVKKWIKPSSQNFILLPNNKKRITWLINFPCKNLKDFYELSFQLKSGNDKLNYKFILKSKSNQNLKLNTR
jgi:hypothetical protein